MKVVLPNLFTSQWYASDGPRAVFDRGGPPKQFGELYLADLAAGTSKVAYTAPAKTEVWWPGISGQVVAWLEYHYPIDAAHAADHWRLMSLDIRNGKPKVMAEADNPTMNGRSPGFAALLSVSGDRVAYVSAKAGKWTIVVRALESGQLLAEIGLEHSPVDLAVSRTRVTWTEGTPNPSTDSVDHMRLLTQQLDSDKATEVAKFAYYLGFDGKRIVWLSDEASDTSGGGPPISPQIFSATVADPSPTPISRPSDGQPTARIQRPAVGNGIAAWWEDENTPDRQGLEKKLVVWREATGEASVIPTDAHSIRVSIAGGWITWLDEPADGQLVVRGMAVQDLFAP